MAESTAHDRAAADGLLRLLAIVRQLRSPEGCAWDRAQDLPGLRPYLIEEAYEVLDALDSGDLGELRVELGDLLFQIVFQAQIAGERGAFGFAEVVASISEKLVRRHPHIFPATGGAAHQDQRQAAESGRPGWAELKRAERLAQGATAPSALDGIPRQAPALLRAERMGEKAAGEGFDWPSAAGARAKLDEELAELDAAVALGEREQVAAELGDVLFSICNLARWLQAPAEDALRASTRRFEARFRFIERTLAASGRRLQEVGAEEADQLWQAAKRALANK